MLGFGLGLGFAMICSGHSHLCLTGCGNNAPLTDAHSAASLWSACTFVAQCAVIVQVSSSPAPAGISSHSAPLTGRISEQVNAIECLLCAIAAGVEAQAGQVDDWTQVNSGQVGARHLIRGETSDHTW